MSCMVGKACLSCHASHRRVGDVPSLNDCIHMLNWTRPARCAQLTF